MAELPQFQRRQYELTAHIRDPEHNPPPDGVEDRRLAIYRDLFLNNISSLLAKSFPVIRKILGQDDWQALMRDYFARHQAHTPYFLEMPREFLVYLQDERGEQANDLPFLLELAHYEWAELAISILETDDYDPGEADRDGDLLDGIPVMNPAAWSLVYGFAVHRISPQYLPTEAGEQPTYLVVYRDHDDQVGFLEINAVTNRLIELLNRDEDRTGYEVLEQIAGELEHPKPETVINGGRDILVLLKRHDIIAGVKNKTNSGDSPDG